MEKHTQYARNNAYAKKYSRKINPAIFAVLFPLFSSIDLIADPLPVTISNSILSIGVGTHLPSKNFGGAIDSLKVLGEEVLNDLDAGRVLQASLHFGTNPSDCIYSGGTFYNPDEAGTDNHPSTAFSYYHDTQTNHVVTSPVISWPNGESYPSGLQIQNILRVGPLPWAPFSQIAEMRYEIANNGSSIICPEHQVIDQVGATTYGSFLPAAYFKYSSFQSLWGMDASGNWHPETPNDFPTWPNPWTYHPSHYNYRVMAWCKTDSWCVGLYGRAAANQTVNPYNYAAQNFSASNGYPNGPTRNLSLLDPLPTIAPGSHVERIQYIIVGDRPTIGYIANWLYSYGP